MDFALFVSAVERIAATQPFAVAENYIDSLPLDDEHKSALWLLALVTADRGEARGVALDSLMLVV